MSILKKKITLITIFFLLFSVLPTMAETIEEFLIKNAKGEINSGMIHNDGKIMIIIGNQTITVDKNKYMQLLGIQKNMGANTEILDFKILNQYNTEDIISVVAKIKAKVKTGKTEVTAEQISHIILMKKGDSFVIVFSIDKQ